MFFLFLLQNIDCGYSLEPPRRGGSNVYPQSMFGAKVRKIGIPLHTPVLLYVLSKNKKNIKIFPMKFFTFLI